MIYLFGSVTLLLAGAVVVLFAMMGELSARVGVDVAPDNHVEALSDALVGREPQSWPGGLSAVGSADDGIVLVLSTSCTTCRSVAQQLQSQAELGLDNLAVVVSTADDARGELFVEQYGLDRLPVHIDVGGEWVGTEFGVRTSPSALLFRRGRLVSALLFGDIATLGTAVAARIATGRPQSEEESWQTTSTSRRG